MGRTEREPPVLNLVKWLEGLLFGDRGYIKAELFQQLYDKGLKLVTGIKKNMKNQMMLWMEKILLHKRPVIETVFSVLKNTLELEHTRHWSPTNAFVHILTTLVTYCCRTNKPAIKNNHLIPNLYIDFSFQDWSSWRLGRRNRIPNCSQGTNLRQGSPPFRD